MRMPKLVLPKLDCGLCARLRRGRQVLDESEAPLEYKGNKHINPVIKTYLHSSDVTGRKRFWLLWALVLGSFIWWVGPALGLFIIDPYIQLALVDQQIIDPSSPCYFPNKASACEDEVFTDWYFFNLTNSAEWLAGDAPPVYEEVGPYSFKLSEVHFNVSFAYNWTEVDATYYQWYDFYANQSCATCDLNNPLVGVNRGYLQYLSGAPVTEVPYPEEPITLQLLSITMSIVFSQIQAALRPGVEAYLTATYGGLPDEATVAGVVGQQALSQWINCGALMAATSSTAPYLPVGPGAFPYAPELCAFIPGALMAAGVPGPITPADFSIWGADLNMTAVGAFLAAAIGSSNATYLDSAASHFVRAFLMIPRSGLVPLLEPALASALGALTDPQWQLLQGYLAYNVAPTWGKMVYDGWLATQPPMKLSPEEGVIYTLTPMTLYTVLGSIETGLTAGSPASISDYLAPFGLTLETMIQMQWSSCGALVPLAPYGLPPLMKQLPGGGYPYNPELCAFLVGAAADMFGLTIQPTQLGSLGLSLPLPAVQAFLGAALGDTNATSMDAAASQWVLGFLNLLRADVMAALRASNATRPQAEAWADALDTLTDLQWGLLQGYIQSLVPTWGKIVMQGYLAGSGGGLVVTKTVDEFLYGFEDPLLLQAAKGGAVAAGYPEGYKLTPWLFRPSLAVAFPYQSYPIDYFTNVTGAQYTLEQLSYRNTDIGQYLPLVQQKRQYTGKGRIGGPTEIMEYRGISFSPRAYGILNHTGPSEGVAIPVGMDKYDTPTIFDSMLAQPVKVAFTGENVRVKLVPTYQFSLHDESLENCDWTSYGNWALASGFDEDAYTTAVAGLKALPPAEYWATVHDQAAMTAYFNSTQLGTLDRYFNYTNAKRDRCTVPNLLSGAWDMSGTFGCPTLYTSARYYRADPSLLAATGTAEWNASREEHAWTMGMEPTTGFGIVGSKTYQVTHLVGRTKILYPDLWVANNTGAASGLGYDFVAVPSAWWKVRWEPKTKDALLIRGIIQATDIIYYLFVVSFPAIGWVLILISFPALIFSKFSKERRKALVKLQKSHARKPALTGRELLLVDAIVRINRGSLNVVVPDDIPEGHSDEEREVDSELEGDEEVGVRRGDKRAAAAPALTSSAPLLGAGKAAAAATVQHTWDAEGGPAIAALRGSAPPDAFVAIGIRAPAANLTPQPLLPTPRPLPIEPPTSLELQPVSGRASGDLAPWPPAEAEGEVEAQQEEDEGEISPGGSARALLSSHGGPAAEGGSARAAGGAQESAGGGGEQ